MATEVGDGFRGGHIIVPSSIKKFHSCVPRQSTNMVTLSIPNSVTPIGNEGFLKARCP